MEDIRDIKGFVQVPHDGWWIWLLVFALAAVAALVFWFWKRRRPTAATETVALPTAYEVAMQALQRLREEKPDIEEFYTRLSDIVRRYLEDQLGLRAPERTTEEFLYEMARNQKLSAEHKKLLGAFLEESDLVKFARFRPGEEDKQRAFAAAEKFVQEAYVGATSRSRSVDSLAAGRPLLPDQT